MTEVQANAAAVENKAEEVLLEVKDIKTYFHIGKGRVIKAVDGVNFTLNQQFVWVIFNLMIFKPRESGNLREYCADTGLCCAGSNHISIGTLAQNSRNRINHD